MNKLLVKVTLLEEMLGTASSNPEIHDEFIASKAPDAATREMEVEALGAEEVAQKGTTIFAKDTDGTPVLWDYQIKGFFKDACGSLRRIKTSKSSAMKNYKKVIDGNIFVKGVKAGNRKMIRVENAGELTTCQRPLRAQTAQGERVALASSESAQAGATLEFIVKCQNDTDLKTVKEWLAYGVYRGLGQWRNSGKGRFRAEVAEWEETSGDEGKWGELKHLDKVLSRKDLEEACIDPEDMLEAWELEL